MPNVLLEEIEYKVDETGFGTWRRYGYINGTSYHEFTSHAKLFGMPLVHYTYGQLAIGIIFGLGQLATGLWAIGQIALGLVFGLGQFAMGYVAIGQFAFGKYVLAQFGWGEFVWIVKRADMQAIEFFKHLPFIKDFLP